MTSRLSALFLCCATAVAQQNSSDRLDMAFDLLRAALGARIAPLGFDVPRENIQWDVITKRLNDDAFIFTFRPEHGAEFQLQATLCEVDKTDVWSDATLLGPKETANEFYENNLKYLLLLKDSDYVRCGAPGTLWSQVGHINDGRRVYSSEDRLLKHMSNWMFFLADKQSPQRAVDFMRAIIVKQREALMEADRKQDYERVATRIQLFDDEFPFRTFEESAFAPEDYKMVRDWLQFTLAERKKLKVLAPALARNIGRDEALLGIFAQTAPGAK